MSCYFLGEEKGDRRGIAELNSANISFTYFSAPKNQ